MNKDKNTIEESIPKKPMKFLWYGTKPHKWFAFFAFVSVTIASLIGSGSPYFFKQIIDTAVEVVSAGGTDFGTTWNWVIAYLGFMTISYIAWRSSGLLGMQWAVRTRSTTTNALFRYLSLHSHTYFSDRFAGALANKISHAADGTERLIENMLWHYYSTLITVIVSTALIFSTSIFIGLVFLGLIVVIVFVSYLFVKTRRPLIITYATENSKLRGQIVDVASNMSAVRQFARRAYEVKLLEEQVDVRAKSDVKHWRLSEYGLGVNNAIIMVAITIMFISTLSLLTKGEVTIGAFVMVITLMFNMLGTLTFIGNAMNGFVRIYGEIEEGLEEILIDHEIVDEKHIKNLVVTEGELMFENVKFSYGKESVFDALNLQILPGQRVGIVGPSGAGKTTFVSILLRQSEIGAGSISIDGSNITEVTQDSLRSNIGLVPQEPLLFHRSVRENIRYGKLDATDEEVERAARMAEAHDFISNTQDGYETLVGERGIKLSGGQRQRIAIARAILKAAPILVLDEATSALDSESEVAIQKGLHKLMVDKTVIAIAHRLSTIKEMDRILVFEDGKIVQDGSHDELLKDLNGTYGRLWNHQAGGFMKG